LQLAKKVEEDQMIESLEFKKWVGGGLSITVYTYDCDKLSTTFTLKRFTIHATLQLKTVYTHMPAKKHSKWMVVWG